MKAARNIATAALSLSLLAAGTLPAFAGERDRSKALRACSEGMAERLDGMKTSKQVRRSVTKSGGTIEIWVDLTEATAAAEPRKMRAYCAASGRKGVKRLVIEEGYWVRGQMNRPSEAAG